MKTKKLFLLLIGLWLYTVGWSQTPGLVSGNVDITSFPVNIGGNRFQVTGNFSDPKGLYFPADIDTAMYFWKDNDFYLIDSIIDNSGNPISFVVNDINSTGFISTGNGQILEATIRLELPGVATTGDSNPALATPPDHNALLNYIIWKIDRFADQVFPIPTLADTTTISNPVNGDIAINGAQDSILFYTGDEWLLFVGGSGPGGGGGSDDDWRFVNPADTTFADPAYRTGNTSVGVNANTHKFRTDGIFQFNPEVGATFDWQDGTDVNTINFKSLLFRAPGGISGSENSFTLAANDASTIDRTILGTYHFAGVDTSSTGFYSGAYIRAIRDGNWTSSNKGTTIDIWTTAPTENFPRQNFTFQGDGRFELDRYFLFEDGAPDAIMGYNNSSKDAEKTSIVGIPGDGKLLGWTGTPEAGSWEWKDSISVANSGGVTTLYQSSPPTDTTVFWQQTASILNSVEEFKQFLSGSWKTIRWYDPITDTYSNQRPIYLFFTGQSNMTSSNPASCNTGGDCSTDSTIVMWNFDSGAWEIPDKDFFGDYPTLNPNDPNGRNNPGWSMAKAVRKRHPDRIVRFLHYAISSTSILNWLESSGPLVNLNTYVADSGTPYIDAIIWLQGEADSDGISVGINEFAVNDPADDNYVDSLTTLIDQYRDESWFGRSGVFLTMGLYEHTNYRAARQDALRQLNWDGDAYTAHISSAGLSSSDNLHFNSIAIDSLGQRGAAVFSSMPKDEGSNFLASIENNTPSSSLLLDWDQREYFHHHINLSAMADTLNLSMNIGRPSRIYTVRFTNATDLNKRIAYASNIVNQDGTAIGVEKPVNHVARFLYDATANQYIRIHYEEDYLFPRDAVAISDSIIEIYYNRTITGSPDIADFAISDQVIDSVTVVLDKVFIEIAGSMTVDDTVFVSYNPGFDRVRTSTGTIAVPLNNYLARIDFSAPVNQLSSIEFQTLSEITRTDSPTSNTYEPTSGGFSAAGLSTSFLPANTEGLLQIRWANSDTTGLATIDNFVIGFNSTNDNQGFTGLEAAIYSTGGSGISKIDNGSTSSIGLNYSEDNYYRIFRAIDGTITLQESSAPDSGFTIIHTFSFSSTGILYCNIGGRSSGFIVDPQKKGF